MMRGSPRGEPRPRNLRTLATALGWTPDSIDRLLAGEDPEVATPHREVNGPVPTPLAGDGSAELRQRVEELEEALEVATPQFRALVEDVAVSRGRIEALELLVAELTKRRTRRGDA